MVESHWSSTLYVQVLIYLDHVQLSYLSSKPHVSLVKSHIKVGVPKTNIAKFLLTLTLLACLFWITSHPPNHQKNPKRET